MDCQIIRDAFTRSLKIIQTATLKIKFSQYQLQKLDSIRDLNNLNYSYLNRSKFFFHD